jgi:hypothetical protein
MQDSAQLAGSSMESFHADSTFSIAACLLTPADEQALSYGR